MVMRKQLIGIRDRIARQAESPGSSTSLRIRRSPMPVNR
jgi:hypothetical protein